VDHAGHIPAAARERGALTSNGLAEIAQRADRLLLKSC
jgi:hypothetical protein